MTAHSYLQLKFEDLGFWWWFDFGFVCLCYLGLVCFGGLGGFFVVIVVGWLGFFWFFRNYFNLGHLLWSHGS